VDQFCVIFKNKHDARSDSQLIIASDRCVDNAIIHHLTF